MNEEEKGGEGRFGFLPYVILIKVTFSGEISIEIIQNLAVKVTSTPALTCLSLILNLFFLFREVSSFEL